MVSLQNNTVAENSSPSHQKKVLLEYLVFKCQRHNATETGLELDLASSCAYGWEKVCENEID